MNFLVCLFGGFFLLVLSPPQNTTRKWLDLWQNKGIFDGSVIWCANAPGPFIVLLSDPIPSARQSLQDESLLMSDNQGEFSKSCHFGIMHYILASGTGEEEGREGEDRHLLHIGRTAGPSQHGARQDVSGGSKSIKAYMMRKRLC